MTLNPFRRGQDPLPSGAASRVTAGGAPTCPDCGYTDDAEAVFLHMRAKACPKPTYPVWFARAREGRLPAKVLVP